MRHAVIAPVLAFLVGCSAGAGPVDGVPVDAASGSPTVDAAAPIDARPAAADANRSACPAGLPEKNLEKVIPLVVDQNMTPEYYFMFASVSEEPDPVQQLIVQLYPGTGIFTDGIEATAYPIAGPDADFQRCSACVFLYAEKDALPYALFMADSGTIQLEGVRGSLTGTLENVHFRAIDIVYDGDTCDGSGDPVCGNTSCVGGRCGRQVDLGTCDTLIESLAF